MPNVPKSLETDKERLTQILVNLVANAVKFTQTGGIILKISLVSIHEIEFRVIDTGIGMKEEDLERLFQAFGRLEASEELN